MDAYCVKCKEKREMKDPVADFTANGVPMTRGVCPVCGTKLCKMGRTEAHEGMEKPAVVKAETVKKSAAKSTKTASAKKSAAAAKKPAVKKAAPAKKTSYTGSTAIRPSQSLVIVESPAKAKTVGRFLGRNYVVRASVGHVRDLLKSTMSIDVEHDFAPKYRVPNEKKELVKELTALAAGAKKVYLATDPDREGEAIAWHLQESAEIDPAKTERVVFHEITEPAINAAFANPGKVNMDLVDAQQARRILDRLVGYNLSPLLWNKVQAHLSAGRVQSVALKLVVDREREIQNFVPKEYWTIRAELIPEGGKQSYMTNLVKINGKDPQLENEAQVQWHLAHLEKAGYRIVSMKTGEKKRKPFPPFTTSTLQQEASKRLSFSSKKTMSLAQQLYEGLPIGEEGSVGLITYMRTDSTNISEVAQADARKYITSAKGKEYVPAKPPVYTKKAKGAQEAHEAVRPTSVFRTPEAVEPYLTKDLYRLYQLIWQRFVASQMADAVYKTESVDVEAEKVNNKYLFRASGQKLLFPGFLAVYSDVKDDDSKDEEENTIFPNGLAEGQTQNLKKLHPAQHFTQPPSRFTEATLVRAMEENGIGRPSTYASIISTIEARNYVYVEKRRLFPTEIGMTVNDLLVEHFADIMDVGFTSQMESELDRVAEGEKDWVSVVREFYGAFEPELEKAKQAMPEVPKAAPKEVGRACPQCGKPLVYRNGRFGQFISCSGFPACHYTEAIVEKIGVQCPKCGGDIVVKRTRKGKVFYGCGNYPKCDFTEWNRPIAKRCPVCGSLMTIAGKNRAQCTNQDCKKSIKLEEPEEKDE